MESRLPVHRVTGSAPTHPAHAARPAARTAAVLAALGIAALVIAVAGIVGVVTFKSARETPAIPTSAQLITVTPTSTGARP